MRGYPMLAARLYNTPLLIEPGKAQIIESVFRAYAEGRQGDLPEFEAKAPHVMPAKTSWTDEGYLLADGGVAILQVHGTLVQRAGGMDALSGLTGYNRIQQQLQAALADPKVRGIVLEVDSPGGEAAGVFDLAWQIANASKPISAHANEAAFSAAYALASAAQEGLHMPESGMVGSVGVVLMHVDQSQMDAKRGLVYTPIFAGAKKVDYSSHAPLSDRARASAQEMVDRTYQIFVDHVASARGIDAAVVRGTEAGLLTPGQAVDLKMADGVASFAEAVQRMQDKVSNTGFSGFHPRPAGASSSKGTIMADPKDAPANTAATEQQLASVRAEGIAAGKADGLKEGATTERARVKAILTCDAAKERPQLAQHLAFDTDQSPEAATALLAKAGVEAPAKAKNQLDAAMRGTNVTVGTGGAGEQSATAAAPTIDTANIYDMRRKASGHAR